METTLNPPPGPCPEHTHRTWKCPACVAIYNAAYYDQRAQIRRVIQRAEHKANDLCARCGSDALDEHLQCDACRENGRRWVQVHRAAKAAGTTHETPGPSPAASVAPSAAPVP